MKTDWAQSERGSKKLLIIGIDALDPTLLSKWSDILPNLSQLARNGIRLPLTSVFPSDSIPAWATIYTGVDPSEHGILGSIDYLKRVNHVGLDADVLRGNTFWDKASRAGKRVCILNPFLAYPVWPVNGVMISGPSLSHGPPMAFPPSIIKDYQVPELGGFTDFPSREDLTDILQHCVEATERLRSFGLQLLDDVEWDLFFICFLTLDRVQHFFWRFGDPEDPYYPGRNRFEDAIKKFYVTMDETVAAFYRKTDADVAFMVISDHGHRRRATKLVNLNEFLLREGYLKAKGRIAPRLLEGIRSSAVSMARRLRAERLLFRFGRFLPGASALRESKFSLNHERSMATLDDFGGSTCFGGVHLNQDAIKVAGLDYRSVLENLASALVSLKDPDTNLPLVRQVFLRDQIYKGECAEKFPEIMFELDKEYGVHWSIYDQLIVPDYAHALVSGGHCKEAVFLLSRYEKVPMKMTMDLTDIAPTVLHILGAAATGPLDGQSIFGS